MVYAKYVIPPPCEICADADTLRAHHRYSAANVVMDNHPRCKKCTCLVGGEHLAVLPPDGDICLQCLRLMAEQIKFGCYSCGKEFPSLEDLENDQMAHGIFRTVVLPTIAQRYDSFPTMEGQ